MSDSKWQKLMQENLKKNAEEARDADRKAAHAEALKQSLTAQQDRLSTHDSTLNTGGQMEDKWAIAEKEAAAAIHPSQNAYNDWRSAMTSLLALFSSFCDAAHHSIDKVLAPIGLQAADAIIKQPMKSMFNKIADKFRDVKIDDLDVAVEYKDGKLDLNLTTPYPELGEKAGELSHCFENGIKEWLKADKWTVRDDKTVVKENDSSHVMTNEEFSALKEDPEKGLRSFLDGTSLHYAQIASPSPSPAPGR